MYYDYAQDMMYNVAWMRGAAVWGKLEPRKKKGDKPDKEGFKKAYGDRVKKQEGGGPVVVTG